ADAEAHRSRLLAAMTALPADANPFRAVLSGCLAVAAGYGAQRERLVLRRRVLSTSVQLRASSAERQRGWEDDVVQLLARRAEARGGPPEFELRLVTATALAALRVALDEWVAGDAGRDLQQLVEDAFRRV